MVPAAGSPAAAGAGVPRSSGPSGILLAGGCGVAATAGKTPSGVTGFRSGPSEAIHPIRPRADRLKMIGNFWVLFVDFISLKRTKRLFPRACSVAVPLRVVYSQEFVR